MWPCRAPCPILSCCPVKAKMMRCILWVNVMATLRDAESPPVSSPAAGESERQPARRIEPGDKALVARHRRVRCRHGAGVRRRHHEDGGARRLGGGDAGGCIL